MREEKSEKKGEEEEACRKVRVAINIDHIFSIDVQKQTWTVAFTAIYEWNDPDLKSYSDEDFVDWSKHFVPNIQFEGAHELNTESDILRPRIHDAETNTAKLTLKYKGEFTARVKLQHYPFDVHLFVLHLKPRKHGKASDPDHLRVVKLVNFGQNVKGSANRRHKLNSDGLATVPNFDVLMSPDAGKERVGKNGTDYHLRVLIVRRSAHIIQNIVLFVMMIQTLSFTAFWLDPIQELSDRLQVVRLLHLTTITRSHNDDSISPQVLTLLLTVVAFKLMIKEQLPSVPYMTDLDKYIFAVTTMLFAQAFMHLLPKKYGVHVDLMCFQILVSFFVLQHTWAIWVLYSGRELRNHLREVHSDLGLKKAITKRRRLSSIFKKSI